MTTTRTTRSEPKPRAKHSLLGALAGALVATLLLASCGKTDSQGSGETHFLSYCEQSCDSGFECVCGACTKTCESDAECGATNAASSCSPAPAGCAVAARSCDVECTTDEQCAAVGDDAECQAGRCRVGTPPVNPPPDPFAVCGDARPPSTCDFAATCENLGCGGFEFDERGCARSACTSDADCSGGDVCFYTPSANNGSCSVNPETGGCSCSGPAVARAGAFCNPPSTTPALGELCDGSDGVRLALTQGGGFVQASYEFMNPHGGAFLAVNGDCTYVVQTYGSSEVRTGVLTEAGAAELASAAGWRLLPLWAGYVQRSVGCVDGGEATLLAPDVDVSCSCGCDENAPSGLPAALSETYALFDEYYAAAAAYDGPVRAVALNLGGSGFGLPDEQPVFDWPLPWSVETLLYSSDALLNPPADSGEVILNIADANALRALRAQNKAAGVTNDYILVRSEGTVRALLVRDELSSGFAELSRLGR